MKKIIIRIRNFVIHEKIVFLLIYITNLIIGNQVSKGRGLYTASKVYKKGRNVKFNGKSIIHDAIKLRLGNNVRIGSDCFFFCMGGLEIGDGTIISRNVTIYTANHMVRSEAIPYNDQYDKKPVRIGKGVWIGMNVAIIPGVSIGDGAIIGMNTVVSSDVMAGEIVVGASQRVSGCRDMTLFDDQLTKEMFFAKMWPES